MSAVLGNVSPSKGDKEAWEGARWEQMGSRSQRQREGERGRGREGEEERELPREERREAHGVSEPSGEKACPETTDTQR